MNDLLEPVVRSLRGLRRFSGRDARRTFWTYALTVIGGASVALVVLMAWTMREAVANVQRFALEHPDQVTVTSGYGSYSIQVHGHHPELMPDPARLCLFVAGILTVAAALLAAAVVRRLHDSGHSGYWGLAPLPFLAAGLAVTPTLFAALGTTGVEGNAVIWILALVINNLLYLASLALLIVMLTRESAAGANRYGPPES